MAIRGTQSTQEYSCNAGPSQEEITEIGIPDHCMLIGTKRCYINRLPPELLATLISEFLPLQERGRMMRVCKYLYVLSKEHFTLMRPIRSMDWNLFNMLIEKKGSFGHVKTFNFMNAPLSMYDFKMLVNKGPFPSLKEAHLHINFGCFDQFFMDLLEPFQSVEALYLYDFKKKMPIEHELNDSCLKILAQFPNLRQFHCYFNCGVHISDKGIDTLISCSQLEIVEFGGILENVSYAKLIELSDHLKRFYLNHYQDDRLYDSPCIRPSTNPRLRDVSNF